MCYVLAQLRTAEQRLAEAVQACRDAGMTWQYIADDLGVTKQGAQQRYGRAQR